MSTVQIAMIGGLPYTALRDAILTHPRLVEGLMPLFSSVAYDSLLAFDFASGACLGAILRLPRLYG
ncbi:MAG: hypothetical protein ACRD18_07965 [Terriglobia bacterium]